MALAAAGVTAIASAALRSAANGHAVESCLVTGLLADPISRWSGFRPRRFAGSREHEKG